MPTFDEIMAVVALPEDTVPVCLAANLQNQIAELQRQRADAPAASNVGERSPAAVLDERITEVTERMKASTVNFKLRAIPGREWEPLWLSRPDRAEGEADKDFGFRHFPWAAEVVARTCVDPVMSAEQVGELVDRLHGYTWATLQNACFVLNMGKVEVPNFASVSPQTPTSDGTSKPPTGPDAAIRNGSTASRQKSPRTSTTTGTASSVA